MAKKRGGGGAVVSKWVSRLKGGGGGRGGGGILALFSGGGCNLAVNTAPGRFQTTPPSGKRSTLSAGKTSLGVFSLHPYVI